MQTQIRPEQSLVAAYFLLSWLARPQAHDTITALPPAQARTIVQAIRTVHAQVRKVRGCLDDLT